MVTTKANRPGKLVTPERNNFYYGKLMDVAQCKKDSTYFNYKRWLLNQHILGSGVLRGLKVFATELPKGILCIEPGIAIDALGREIVVQSPVHLDPYELRDLDGERIWGRVDIPATVNIYLRYKEAMADHVPVAVPDCDTPNSCAPNTIREEFAVVVQQANEELPSTVPGLQSTFPFPIELGLGQFISDLIAGPIPQPPPDECVPTKFHELVFLAAVKLGSDDKESISIIKPYPPYVHGNTVLSPLLVSLAHSVEQLAQGRFLRYQSGDGQTGRKGGALPRPLAVQVVDAEGKGIDGETVVFKVTKGKGTLKPTDVEISEERNESRSTRRRQSKVTVETQGKGFAEVSWSLAGRGDQEVEVAATRTPLTVTFRATIEESVEP